ncbi:Klhl12 [Scenedesmus sp. PABB004]|nr:Klhl12 [Scenedesmus sp. PABB004]
MGSDLVVIQLNVGGTRFTTTVATLTSELAAGGELARLVEKRGERASQRLWQRWDDAASAAEMGASLLSSDDDPTCSLFIDRDGALFGHVLSWLRTGDDWVPPGDTVLLRQLQVEARFYGLQRLADKVTTELKHQADESRSEQARAVDQHRLVKALAADVDALLDAALKSHTTLHYVEDAVRAGAMACEQASGASSAFQAAACASLAQLWRQGALCDVVVRCADGGRVPAHRVVLAASCRYVRALLCGAGASMREGAAPSVVDLPYSQPQVEALLAAIYDHRLEVSAGNVAWLLDMAAYLEVAPLQEACCAFLRAALTPETAVDVVLLAHHYNCAELQAEGVQYLAQHLPSLLVAPDARAALCRLPAGLLQQLLSCDALEVAQEAELLCLVSDWVAGSPAERLAHLHALLSSLQLSLLPQEAPLSPQQLTACTHPGAASLAQTLHQAALQCQRTAAAAAHGGGGPAGPLRAASGQPSSPAEDAAFLQQLRQQQHQEGAAAARGDAPAHGSAAVAGGAGADAQQRPCWADPNNHTSTSAGSTPTAAAAATAAGAAWPGQCGGGGDGDDCARGVGAVLVEAWPGRQRGYQPTQLLVAGGHNPSWRALKSVELYDPRADAWAPGPTLPAALPFAGAGLLGRSGLHVVGGGMYASVLARLDAGAGAWLACDGPRTPRVHAAVAGCAGLLYVAGGRSQANQVVPTVEAYDPAAPGWCSLPDMARPRYAHALAALGGRVYALGGQASKAIHRSVEVFDPARGAWAELAAPLRCERKYCAAVALGGRLVVLGGMSEARARLASAEAFDPREGRFAALPPMAHARSSCGAAAIGGATLYAVGGSAGDQELHDAVEAWDAAAGRWRPCAPLASGRSGLLAAASAASLGRAATGSAGFASSSDFASSSVGGGGFASPTSAGKRSKAGHAQADCSMDGGEGNFFVWDHATAGQQGTTPLAAPGQLQPAASFSASHAHHWGTAAAAAAAGAGADALRQAGLHRGSGAAAAAADSRQQGLVRTTSAPELLKLAQADSAAWHAMHAGADGAVVSSLNNWLT